MKKKLPKPAKGKASKPIDWKLLEDAVEDDVQARTQLKNLKESVAELASCAVFTLGHYKHLGRGTGQVIDLKTRELKGPWQNKFFDALDAFGYELDRDAYYASQTRSKKKRT